jgi:hypothetical protein
MAVLTADVGDFAINGQVIEFIGPNRVYPLPGNFVVGGQSVGLVAQVVGRDMPIALREAALAVEVLPALFVDAEFAAGVVRIWSGLGEISAGGQAWQGVGSLLSVSPFAEAQDLRATGLTVTISGIPAPSVALALGENYHGRPARVLLGAFDAGSGALLAAPHPVFAGRMDVLSLTEGAETAEVSLAVENRLIDLDRQRVVRYTAETQERLFPGDVSLQFVPSLVDAQVTWGRG